MFSQWELFYFLLMLDGLSKTLRCIPGTRGTEFCRFQITYLFQLLTNRLVVL
ncbi:hypothetical protein HMPREF0880_01957 [Yokenella regensburgei ATCC 43003]|nr:hypothetical protein HMPREF0880_01957 [Yokenella regensburgei ATCC 43003]